MARKPLFLDRDGVINVDVTPYVARLEQLEIFPWTVEALVKLDQAGYDIYVVSNQQGVSLGITTQEDLDKITEAIQAAIRPHGVQIKKFYYCTSLKGDNSEWRKPKPGMLLAAKEEFGLDLESTYMVGDKWSDMECADSAGVSPILVMSGVTKEAGEWDTWTVKPTEIFPTLKEAAEWLCNLDV